MKTAPSQARAFTAAQRGQIVQRILVDGWSTRQAAAAARVDERLVAAWVVAFRRDGMASLNRPASGTLTGVILALLRRPLSSVGRALAKSRPAVAVSPLRLSQDDPPPRRLTPR